MPTLPQSLEPLEALQARYPEALRHLFDVEAIARGDALRPGECPGNVFDHEDGLRLIVSREKHPDGPVRLHYSASFHKGSRIDQEWRLLLDCGTKLGDIWNMWIHDLPRRFRLLSGDMRPEVYLGPTSGCVPHFMIEESAG